jgi:hypothetical protein
MTEISTPTSQQIDANASAVHQHIASLEAKMPELSLAAVAGDQDAIASLADIQAQIRQAKADLSVLDLAKDAAIKGEIATDAAKAQAYREHHMEIARTRAADLMKLAARLDELVLEFKKVFGDLTATEREIWNALRKASASPDDGVVGRKNLGHFAIASLTAFTNGTDRFRQVRGVADVASVAWGDLLKSKEQADV